MAPDADKQPELWQTIDQWMGTPEFRRMMEDEFPEDAAEWLDPVTRRRFLTLMGASIALAGAAGCNPSFKPASQRTVVPYVKKPEPLVYGVPLFFPTARKSPYTATVTPPVQLAPNGLSVRVRDRFAPS